MFSFLPRLGTACVRLRQAVCIFSRCEEEGRNGGCGEGEGGTREGTSEEEGRSRGCGEGEGGKREETSEEEGRNRGCGEGDGGRRRFESHRCSFSQLRHGFVSGCG